MLAETVERLVGAAVELLRDRDIWLPIRGGRGELDGTGFGEQRLAGGVEEADLTGREGDFGGSLAGGDTHLSGRLGHFEFARGGRLRYHQAWSARSRPGTLWRRDHVDDAVAVPGDFHARGGTACGRHLDAPRGPFEPLRVCMDRCHRAAEQQRR